MKPPDSTELRANLNVISLNRFIVYFAVKRDLSFRFNIVKMKDKECSTKPVYDPEILPDLLPLYYKRLFPHSHFYRWLSYGNGM